MAKWKKERTAFAALIFAKKCGKLLFKITGTTEDRSKYVLNPASLN
jgi:hypothetical protein